MYSNQYLWPRRIGTLGHTHPLISTHLHMYSVSLHEVSQSGGVNSSACKHTVQGLKHCIPSIQNLFSASFTDHRRTQKNLHTVDGELMLVRLSALIQMGKTIVVTLGNIESHTLSTFKCQIGTCNWCGLNLCVWYPCVGASSASCLGYAQPSSPSSWHDQK